MEIENKLAESVVNTRYDDIPEDTVTFAKAIITNVIGATVAGSVAEGIEPLVKLAKARGGAEEATIFVHGGKVPAPEAVLVNSFMARAFDFECVSWPGTHMAATYVPVALAAAEMVGGLSGRDFLTAVIAGSEIGYRMNAATRSAGWDRTGLSPVYAGAAVAGRILGLDEKRMRDALGIAFNRQAGSFQSNIDGSLCVQLIQAYASQAALSAAILAKHGFNGVKNFVEGVYGHFSLFAVDGKYDPDVLVQGLGERYSEMATSSIFKLWPICGGTVIPATLAMDLIRMHGIETQDVERVVVGLWGDHYEVTGKPFHLGDTPRVNAQFSVRYVIANILQRGEPKLAHFDEAAVKALAGTGLIDKIDVERLEGDPRAEVSIETRKGDVYRAGRPFSSGMPGDANDPISPEQRMAVFWQSVGHGALPRENAERLVAMVNDLENVRDVREGIALLVA